MSRAGDSRARIRTALEAGGLEVATTGRLVAPGVLLEAGDPWSEPVRLPGRTFRWRLLIAAGKPDSDAALEELADLVDVVDAALRTLAGVSLPTWSRPVDTMLGNLPYASTMGTIVDSQVP